MGAKYQKLIQTRAIYYKINKTPNTPEHAQPIASENAKRVNETWAKLPNILRKIQQREFPTSEEKRKNKNARKYPDGEKTQKQLMRGKHLIARKLNNKIYTLQKWIMRNQMYPISQAWKTAKRINQNKKTKTGKSTNKKSRN